MDCHAAPEAFAQQASTITYLHSHLTAKAHGLSASYMRCIRVSISAFPPNPTSNSLVSCLLSLLSCLFSLSLSPLLSSLSLFPLLSSLSLFPLFQICVSYSPYSPAEVL